MPDQQTLPAKPFSSNRQPYEIAGDSANAASPYAFNWRSVALAGFLAALAITFYMMYVPEWLGIGEMDIGITVGGMTDPTGGPRALLARLAWHMGNGLIYVPVYAAILLRLRKKSTAWTGVAFGAFLWLAGPMLLVPIALSRPRIGCGDLTNPGIFMLSLGLGWTPAIIDLGAHMTHGILAGVIYRNQVGESSQPVLAYPEQSDTIDIASARHAAKHGKAAVALPRSDVRRSA